MYMCVYVQCIYVCIRTYVHKYACMYVCMHTYIHGAASVAQWLEHLPSKQCRGFESHPSSSFFFSEKKELLG